MHWGIQKEFTLRGEKTSRIVKYAFSIVGLILLLVSLLLFVSTSQFVRKSAIATGTVVALEERTDSDDRTSYHPVYYPVVEFKIAENDTFRFESSFGSNPPSYRIGEKVEVLYDPASPGNAKIKSFLSLWVGVVILGILGFIFFAIGFGMILYRRTRKNRLQ
jgi:heme/copper-type cytochrome/quinol oxidase subunit 2